MINLLTGILLLATASALMGALVCIWIYGSHYIQEPNISTLVAETFMLVLIIAFAVYSMVRQVK